MVAPKSIRCRKPCTFRGGRGIQVRASPSMLGGGGQCGCGCGCGCAARGAGGVEYVGAIFPYIIFIYMDKLY